MNKTQRGILTGLILAGLMLLVISAFCVLGYIALWDGTGNKVPTIQPTPDMGTQIAEFVALYG